LRAFRFFHGFRPEDGDGKAWLLAIVRNTCFTWLKQQRPRAELDENAPATVGRKSPLEAAESPLKSPQLQLLGKEREMAVAGCAEGTARHQELQKLSEDVRRQAPYFRAPEGLRERIRKSLRPASAPWRWAAMAAMILLAFSIAANVMLVRSRPSQQQLLADSI